MRSNEERVEAVKARIAERKKQKKKYMSRIITVSSMAACIMLSAEQESVIEQLIPCLRDQLDDSNDQVRRVALNAVSGLGGEALIDAVGPTIAEMAVDPTIDKYLQRRAILTLAGIYQSSHQLPSVDKVAPKLASFLADPDWGMKMCAANFTQAGKSDAVKFVAASLSDLQRAVQVIEKYHLDERTQVYFSCVFGSLEPADVVDFMKEKKLQGVKLQLQMHKYVGVK